MQVSCSDNKSMLIANESWQKTNESRQGTNFYGYIILSILLLFLFSISINVVIGSFLEWKMQKTSSKSWKDFGETSY